MGKIEDKIIRKFVRNIINESLAPTESFKTDVKGEDINLYYEEEYDKFKDLPLGEEEELNEVIRPESAKVLWGLDIDLRDWGIKDIGTSIENVIVNMDIVSGGDAGFQSITLNAKEEGFNIKNELKITNNSSLIPYSIEIDFKSKEVTVS